MQIPKIIHQLWVGPKTAPVKWMASWIDKNPQWEYVFWDNEKIASHYFANRKHIDYYKGKQQWHGLSDVVRYEILYHYGGFMPEADSECMRPIDSLFGDSQYDAFAVYEHEELAPGLLSPLTAAVPGSKFAMALIQGLYAKPEVGEPWKTVGNLYMKEVAESREWPGLKIFPSHYFNPEHWTGKRYGGRDKPFAKQHWGTTHNLYDSL